MSDLTGKPVRIVAQAFNYAGYDMNPEDLREWVSQSLRCGASAIDYYEMDSPRWTDPARWKMMLYLSGVITRMNRIALPQSADTAVLYTLYTHMSQGASTSGDQVYAAHALLGELAGSWFKFVSDAQLERGEASLTGYKAVYLPLAKYMTPAAAKIIEDYVRAGGVLICGDAEAFAFDLAGNDTSATRERILGLKTLGPKPAAVNREGAKPQSPLAPPDRIILKSAQWGLPVGTSLRLFDLKPGGRSFPWLRPRDCAGRSEGRHPRDLSRRFAGDCDAQAREGPGHHLCGEPLCAASDCRCKPLARRLQGVAAVPRLQGGPADLALRPARPQAVGQKAEGGRQKAERKGHSV